QVWKQYDFKGQRVEIVYDAYGRIQAKFFFYAGASYPSNAVCYKLDPLGQVVQITDRYGADATTNACDGYVSLLGPPPVIGGATGNFSKGKWITKAAWNCAWPALALLLTALALVLLPAEVRRLLIAFYLRGGWRRESRGTAVTRRRVRLPAVGWRAVAILVIIALIVDDPCFAPLFTARADCVIPLNPSTPTTRITTFQYDAE